MKSLIDTDVLSEVRKSDGNATVRERIAAMPPDDLFLSVISLGEIAHGISRLPPGGKRRDLEAWLDVTQHAFADRILAVDRDTAILWGELTARTAAEGHTIHPADGLIAATALRHGLRIVTRNTRHFQPTGAMVLNPWDT